MSTAKKAVEAGTRSNIANNANLNGMRRELMRLTNSHQSASDPYATQDNDDFIESESDRQMLLIKYFFSPSLSFSLFHMAFN